jgi:hypothetical protein
MTTAEQMVAALNEIGPHTFRDGKVVAYIDNFYANGELLMIETISASYDDVPVDIDLPIGWAGYELVGDQTPLQLAYDLISNKIRGL